MKALEPELDDAEAELAGLLAKTPNVPHESSPNGFTDEEVEVIREVGSPRSSTSRLAIMPRSVRSRASSTRNAGEDERVSGSSTSSATSCSCSSRLFATPSTC